MCLVVITALKLCQFRRRLAVDNPPSQQMEMSMLQQVVPRQENYTQSRATALHNVESTISELSGIFTHLATMVTQQGELAIRFSLLAWICVAFLPARIPLGLLNLTDWCDMWAGLMITWMSLWQMLKVHMELFWGISIKYHQIGGF